LRRLGKNAGAYSPQQPSVVDRVLFELGTESQGADMARVARWFADRAGELARLGHRYGARLVAFRTGTILDWVAGGQGHRGAVLVTSGEILHPGAGISAPHALAIAWDPRARGAGREALVAVDPWPAWVASRRCHRRWRTRTGAASTAPSWSTRTAGADVRRLVLLLALACGAPAAHKAAEPPPAAQPRRAELVRLTLLADVDRSRPGRR
jgi:hypothetical protein